MVKKFFSFFFFLALAILLGFVYFYAKFGLIGVIIFAVLLAILVMFFTRSK